MANLKNKHALEEDGIKIQILQNLPDSTLSVLVISINLSWDTGIFLSSLKCANVIAISKGANVRELYNYRLISLLSALMMILKKNDQKSYDFTSWAQSMFE